MPQTKLQNLINPQVMADMISAKLPKKILVTPFAKVDSTLEGRPGNTITVPRYQYIGDAETVAEGAKCPTNILSATSAQYTIKKAKKGVELTDEAMLSGYGNPVGEATNQLAKSIASKLDNDAMDAFYEANTAYDGSAGIISYNGVVNAIDLFNEEIPQEKVMFINPKQLTQLRKDENFISRDKYGRDTAVVMSGEIGMIGGARIVPSRKVKHVEAVAEVKGVYTITIDGTATIGDQVVVNGKTLYTAEAADNATAVATALKTAIDADDDLKELFTSSRSAGVITLTQKVGGTGACPVVSVSDGATITAVAEVDTEGVVGTPAGYKCPIVKVTFEPETEDETAALTIYIKKGVRVETKRNPDFGSDEIYADEFYVAALTDASKVVLAFYKEA